ncbi:MAG: hypothetical protein ACT4QC_11265 [Planctomycetaceae bacterium]
MAKRTVNRRELREQHEAAEKRQPKSAAAGAKSAKDGKKKAAPKAKRGKSKVVLRKRLMWGVFSSSLKEEGRFPFADKEAAENRAAELTQRHKRTYFIQPIKEPIAEKEPEAESSDK